MNNLKNEGFFLYRINPCMNPEIIACKTYPKKKPYPEVSNKKKPRISEKKPIIKPAIGPNKCPIIEKKIKPNPRPKVEKPEGIFIILEINKRLKSIASVAIFLGLETNSFASFQ